MMLDLPDVRRTPCFDCPWLRTSTPGWLGPYDAETWYHMAHGEVPIACHLTITETEDWNDEGVEQCAGVAIYRSNVLKSPRDPAIATLPADTNLVFGHGEFVEHHTGEMK